MEKQVLYRDRQELQAADMNNTQAWADEALRHVVTDAITGERQFSGLNVTGRSATELEVAPGRMYDGPNGKVFALESAQVHSVFAYLPLQDQKWLAVSVFGTEEDTDIQPRDYLIDLQTREVEPEAVAMQRRRVATVHIAQGLESPTPERPEPPTGNTLIAHVRLSPTGVQEVVLTEGRRLPNLQNMGARLQSAEAWRTQAEPRISSIATDLAGLAKKTMSLAGRDTVVELANDVARLKAKVNLPTAYASYESDYFGNAEKTDAAGIGYSAAVINGLLFPTAGQASVGLALFNPYDAAIKRSADDLILPAYTDRARIQTLGYSGDISASQYQVQSQTIREYTATVWDYRYGWNYNYYAGWWNSWYWSYYGYNWGWYGWYGYRVARQETRYELQTVTSNYNGAIIAQTYLVSNAMWLTKVGLQFTKIGASGDVMVAVCETEGGKPNLLKTLTRVTLARGDIQQYPEETAIPVPPVLLEAGKRYALVLITQGDHRLATVSGNDYTQGTLFFGTDGDFFTGDLTKDLMFTLYAAQFAQPRVEVVLQSVSLAGGISDINIAAPQVVPDGCELRYELQVGGKWYALGDPDMRLSNLPDIVPLRVVLLGTSDLAPAFRLAPNAVKGSRAATSFIHWSKLRTLAAPSSTITVQVVVAQWEPAHHTIACEIKSGATTYTPASTVVRTEPDGLAKRITFTFNPPAISTYAIKLTGARSTAVAPFVVAERTDVAT